MCVAWGFWPSDKPMMCAPPDLMFSNGTAVGNNRFLYTTKHTNHFEEYNRYGYFETAPMPTNLSSIPVVRLTPKKADFSIYGKGAETEIVRFYHQPGSNLSLDLTGYEKIELYWARFVEHLAFLKQALGPRQVIFRRQPSGLIEVILRAQSVPADPTPCPDVPFNCECEAINGVFAACAGDKIQTNASAVLACDNNDTEFKSYYLFIVPLLMVPFLFIIYKVRNLDKREKRRQECYSINDSSFFTFFPDMPDSSDMLLKGPQRERCRKCADESPKLAADPYFRTFSGPTREQGDCVAS